ncbi:hypothetical protein MMC17_009896 [Xylographa soralifera]|nr:hypothetical protein [Xylographa soralifera]
MFSSSFLVFFNLFVWLLSGAVATVPSTVYKGDIRKPAELKAAGGIKSRGACHKMGPSDATLFQHVEGQVKYPMRDPWISTTSDIRVSQHEYPTGYIYYIATSGQGFLDVAAEYARARRTYGHASEKEMAINCDIPWSSIIKWDVMKGGKVTDGGAAGPARGSPSRGSSHKRAARVSRMLQQRMQRRAKDMDMLYEREWQSNAPSLGLA